jgi:hypothetical protein
MCAEGECTCASLMEQCGLYHIQYLMCRSFPGLGNLYCSNSLACVMSQVQGNEKFYLSYERVNMSHIS